MTDELRGPKPRAKVLRVARAFRGRLDHNGLKTMITSHKRIQNSISIECIDTISPKNASDAIREQYRN